MFAQGKRKRKSDGTFQKNVWWTPWNDAWSYKMSNELKDMIERTSWTFVEAFIGALTVAPLVGVDAEVLQLAALAGGGAALAVIKTYAKKQITVSK
ncbi:hypothetical protein OAG57_05035 [Akkermansiaceae bacterium]|nr:hypothetical protein [Akkermansiaceae bacterium]